MVSPESMMASAVDQTAPAMSLTSARVGTGEVIIDSRRWVATMTGLRCRMQASTVRFWIRGRSSIGTSIPRSPRATITASDATMISSRFASPDWSSIFATIRAVLFESVRRRRRMSTSSASRAKESAKKSTFSSTPTAMSARSLAVRAGRLTRTPGRFRWRRLLSFAGTVTRQRMRAGELVSTSRRMRPLSTSTTVPAVTSPPIMG